MQRRPLLEVLSTMKGTDKELSLAIVGETEHVEIRNVVDVEPLHSSHGIKVTTRQNEIWIDASHVAVAWQARSDL
jgi:hypothetical protein